MIKKNKNSSNIVEIFLCFDSPASSYRETGPHCHGFQSLEYVLEIMFWILSNFFITGNILIIWIFLNLRRRKRSTFLLIGLGVADLLVGGLAVPLLIATYESASITVWRVFDLVDVFTSTSSIYALAVISVERMFAIGWPLRHRTANFRVYICAIALPWIIAAIFAITFFVYANFIFMTRDSVIYPIVLLPATPLLIMCVAYYVIWRKQKSTICNQNNIIREVKLANTLFLITGASVFTWLPFQILNLLVYLQIAANVSHMLPTVLIIRVLQYSNSFVNVIIYPLRIPEFKNCLLHLLRCCVVHRQVFRAGVLSSAGSGSVVSLVRFTSTQHLSPSSKQESAV